MIEKKGKGAVIPATSPVETMDYLRRIRSAALRLAVNAEESPQKVEAKMSGGAYVNDIARALLSASCVSTLCRGVDDLPPRPCIQSPHDLDSRHIEAYQLRRVDYLRELLRAMAPISIDVAALVCSIVRSSLVDDATRKIKLVFCKAAFILFSQWLEVAPHIKPLVSDLFRLSVFDCPLIHAKEDPVEERLLLMEAAYNLCQFYWKQREPAVLKTWWSWSQVFGQTDANDDMNIDGESQEFTIRWYRARVVTEILDLNRVAKMDYLERHGVEQELVAWVMHPWALAREEYEVQRLQILQRAKIWTECEFYCPSASEIRGVIPLHQFLLEIGPGLVFVKHGCILDPAIETIHATAEKSHPRLFRTTTSARNLSLVGTALCEEPNPPPILLCGPAGSGKSSLVRELASMFAFDEHTAAHHDDQLLEIHVDEETDTKTLVGSYTTTDVPGEFEWRPGALTRAIRSGKWVLLEDLDSIPIEIQASLVQLLKSRLLPLGNGKVERCHPNFRLFGTLTILPDVIHPGSVGGKRILSPTMWRHIRIEPLPLSELKEIAVSMHKEVPGFVVDCVLKVFTALDQSGRTTAIEDDFMDGLQLLTRAIIGRNPSVRDLFKVLSRIAHNVVFESGVSYATEGQRTLCLAETYDIFVAACPDRNFKEECLRSIFAPTWGVSADLALSYIDRRRPEPVVYPAYTEVGRARIPIPELYIRPNTDKETFAQTSYALRLMESIGVCIAENEPTLLVGETGCGKTTILQHLARLSGRDLVVQNLSLQTDSTDLLGGFRPLEIQQVARSVYQNFVDLFTSSFSRKQNADFLAFTSDAMKRGNWKRLSQCFRKAAKLGIDKVKERSWDSESSSVAASWRRFEKSTGRFEQQRLACNSGLAFVFAEGALIEAITRGKWVLLDEINLASSETLQRLCGLLDDPTSSITLTERGDVEPVERHPDFRLFAAMNPATDSGKKDLHASIRSRFTELYVDELLDPLELRVVAERYICAVLPVTDTPPEHTETVVKAVDVYLECRSLAERVLVDGSGQKPRYTLRTLSRALTASQIYVLQQKLPLQRALYEGFELAFQGPLSQTSLKPFCDLLTQAFASGLKKEEMDHPGRRPGGTAAVDRFALIKPFWIEKGPLESIDWSELNSNARSKFVLTRSTTNNLRRLARAVASGPWPILLEGPTSAGKTSLVEYLAARCGHHVIRINNHEHTDVQEYTGSFAADSSGRLAFQDGLLVRALREGHWVILDELNLAPSEVLEALNRLLDDNRELYLPETNETVRPKHGFRLFATQNPSGVYGGRKPLSRAFRNRFTELHLDDIPSSEMITILEKRSGCPPQHAKILVSIMDALRLKRSKSGVFLGKNSFITPRDLLRWAERHATGKIELAHEGFMLLGERLRTREEKDCVREEIEKHLNVKIDLETLYFSESSEARSVLHRLFTKSSDPNNQKLLATIAPTRSLLRLVTLVLRCVRQREPVLLVGDTGCGKTTAVQLLSCVLESELHTINCHATTETSDLLGGLRPVRGRPRLVRRMLDATVNLCGCWPQRDAIALQSIPGFVNEELAKTTKASEVYTGILPDDAVDQMVELARALWKSRSGIIQSEPSSRRAKRQKVDGKESPSSSFERDNWDQVSCLVKEVEDLARAYNALFEWSDGPLVKAVKAGDMILLDEISLAEDAVLERLNSVLEPSRTLVLAEKGSADDVESRVLIAHECFQLFATMNPGGDFGKRELSPALRSRFTEIWVPAVTDSADIDFVLERSLAQSAFEEGTRNDVKRKMIEYFNWFNEHLCTDPSRPYAELALSLRDILTWAAFITACTQAGDDLDIWGIYYHGACLMHLDGLGLGTALASHDSASAKNKAIEFLMEHVPVDKRSTLGVMTNGFNVLDAKFGCNTFRIPVGQDPVAEADFNLEAPTTSVNIFRILRAMQLSKPVLLEGSPGVGKTTLVAALAAASGHKLVRINLSDQTDISDLFGSDLPVPEKDASGNNSASFSWCDGVLLSAIKKGDWVLLDELNLASQAVLEGLNSCLDHRASVYIPELGSSFRCPASFRIFAAQNPLAQGGGRKGLPKSFLNRFTKVFVDSLTDDDLRVILTAKFPSLDEKLIDRVIAFNSRINCDVVQDRLYGQSGAPWEFNLRDVFRWCELLRFDLFGQISISLPLVLARDLYFQRFRAQHDREIAKERYLSIFGSVDQKDPRCKLATTPLEVLVGSVRLARLRGPDITRGPYVVESPLSLIHFQALEAVARCISKNWPCLLVGPAVVGKSSTIGCLAELTGRKLVEICLSPSSDVSELVGCFEQVDGLEDYRVAFASICRVAEEYLLLGGSETEKVCDLLNSIRSADDEVEGMRFAQHIASLLFTELRSRVDLNPIVWDDLAASRDLLLNYNGKMSTIGGHFVWKDGILIEAMEKGYWLHLKHVNLCPASVLDRLNSVMEPNGSLLLAECSSAGEDGGTRHRQVHCHPDFRIFLSMNPEYGEVSRAMRNRCVEIALMDHPALAYEGSYVDAINRLQRIGLRSQLLADTILKRCETSSLVESCGKVMCRLLLRGVTGFDSIASATEVMLGSIEKDHDPWLEKVDIEGASFDRILSFSDMKGQFLSNSMNTVSWEGRALEKFLCKRGTHSTFFPLIHSLGDHHMGISGPNFILLRNHMIALYLCKSTNLDISLRASFLDTFDGSLSGSLHFAANYMMRLLGGPNTTESKIRFPAEGRFDMQHFLSIAFNKVYFRRIPQTLVEQAWYQEQRKTMRSRSFEGSSELCALQVSFLLSTGQIDRSEVVCPVTPHLYPFFNVLDNLIDLIYQDPSNDFGVAPKIDDVLRDRDGLWNLTKNLAFSSSRVDFLCFDEIDFIVQWKWLCDSLQQMSKFVGSFATDNGQERRKLSALSDAIERELYYGGSVRISCSIAKRSNKPFVPKTTEGWNLNMQSRDLAEKCSIWSQRCEIAGERVGDELLLDDLVQHQHPALYVDSEMKEQILAVISMSYLATTGEAGDDGLTERRNLSRQALTAVQARLSVARKHFEQNINLVQMDGQIHTIDNMMSVDDLNALSDASDSVQQLAKTFSQRLMEKFAYMQIAPSAEYWCERQEQFLIRWFCKLLCQVEGDVYCDIQFLAEPIRKFLDVGLHQTFWNLADLRPYQTLLWSLEKKESRDPCWRKLLKNLLPVMTYNASIRVWSNCTVHLKGISQRIEFSNIKETCVLRGSKQSDPQEEALDDLDTLDVPTSTALSLVGGCFTVVHNEAKYLPFSTIENHQARVKQSEALVGIFTIVANGIADTFFPYELFYLFLETVHSLKNSFSSDDFVALNAILRNPTLWNSSQCGDLRRILILSSNELFLDLVDPLVMPLFDLLRRSRSCQSSETTEYGEALIQLGLLRFHLLLPDSPLDPAREPEAKVRALKISKDRLKIERCAIQMDSGLQCGDFCPSHERTKEIDGQLDLIKALHSKHVDRIVSRPVDAPSFVGLYRETNEGARRFLSVAAVHALMHLRSSDFSSASSVQTIANWQSTTEAFCERILSTYAVFEDVVVPLIDCVAMVNRGLKLFFRPTRDSPSGKADLAVAFKFALTFPVSDYDSVFDSAHLMLRSVRLKSVNAHRELAISILSHLVSRRRVAGFDRRSLLLWNHVVRLVAEDETVDNASLPKSDEELEEIEFRRQFPDHSLDFQSLVQHSDEEERDRENLSNSESPAISTLFREEFKVILYSLHRDMFYAKTGMTDESDRVKSFRLQYGTAFLLHRAAAVENSNSLGAAGHIVALALATPSFKGTFVGEQSDYRRGHVYDFHKDPNPVEALKSCEPLLSLQARVSQLLTAFPGNEILLAIARVIDRLKRFDLSVVPLGKLLRGMELLLRQSQDWEQHASERVQLGDSLRSVSETVARWRKAELFSWSSLLTNREAQFQRNAHGHWYKLYRLFMIDPCDDTLGSAESTRINSLDRSTPAWLWKGVNFEGIRLTPAKIPFGTLSELVKALDTFILTSPLGEVGTRLGMIENFAMEKRAEYLHMSAGVECLHLARTLSSLWAYYHQFTAFFLTKISEKRRPLEKRLHEEAKLAKWDEQSYYALSESTEKNYRKLMRILREYDEVLHINVGVILEDELYKGIGQDTDTTRPTTSIPGEAELFPFCPGISKDQEVCICPKTWPAVDPKRSWTNVVGFAVPVEQRSILVSKYLTKMFKLHITERTNPESWGSMGAQEASHLSLSIFDRIQRLRSENTTRPMKERAVTDLLKELKRQGYASTKWSIPKEIQQVESIFQLPSLLSEQRGIGENELIYLQNAEEYYQKCLLEANRLRSEITMMGSRHLTQRQLDIFLSSGEHGLLLLAQQRGVLSSIIIDRRHLQVNVNTLSEVTSSLPTGQTYLNKMVKDLTMKIAASSECMAQTALVLRARSHLTSREDVRSWTRDRTVSMLDLGSRLVKRRIFGGPLVLDRLLVQIHETKTELRSALTLLEDCRYDCMRHGFLPVDSLDTCKKALDLAVEQAARCHEQVTLRDVENPLSFLPRFVEAHSQAVEAALFAVQAVVGNIDGQDVSPSIWDCHRSAIAEWSSVNTNRLSDRLFEVLNQLRLVHDINGLDHEQQQICVGLATDLSFLFAEAMRILDDRLVQFLRFHREAAKLHYVLLRIFRTLCAKGYCSDKTKDGEEEGEGEASGMTFEDDKDGTGMGEGEGKRDVTDEIENEEQLLGLKNEAQNEEKNSEEKGSKQLDEEEAEKGMEMEADFNGEMYDMPDPTPDVRDNDEEDTKEELDREMGEEGGANEEVIDEKMWNDSDNDEDQGDAQDEKLEKDSGVEGGAAGDELTTKDDTKGKEEKEAPQSGDSHKDQANDDPQEDETTAEMVNEDSDDRYEDNHGVNVRDEKLSDEKPDEQQMELDDNLELDDGSPEGNEGDQSSEETIEDVENDDALNKENDNPGNDVAADEQLSEENVEAEDLDTNAIRAENAIPDEVNDEEPEDDSNPDMQPPSQMAREPTDSNEGLGVRAQDGTDAVQDDTREDDDAGGDGKGEEEEVNGQDTQASEMEPSGAGGSSSGANQGQGLTNEGQNWDTSQPFDEIPNPLKNPGDATKYWHRRLNIVQPEGSNDELLEISDQLEQQKTNENAQGDFEYVGENQQGTTQALGEVEDTEAMDLDEIEAEVQGESVLEKEPQRTVTDEKSQEKRRSQTNKDRGPTATKDENAPNDNEDTMDEDGNDFVDRDEASGEYVNENDSEQHATGNQVMADLSQLQVQDDSVALEIYRDTIVEESVLTGASLADQDAARAQWSMIVGNTHSLSRRLCEKLRLVLEPLVASKLRGDYRTGKRINMKRVIGYVASGYRKDKIWLRRTKPAKRDYRILLAVDDSESMKAGAGDIALHALATLANGMGQLDVGELGVASFGNEMRLLHDFHQPFTAESGANVVRNFTFAQPRTRTALCVESALQALDAAGGNSSMQLVFLISDGRIERDSRETLRRLIREMMERNILLAMVIVESSANARSSSIVNMKEVSFENGKPKVKSFIEDYPFPYYIVLKDMQTLPEVLGDALRQWFEMLLRLQTKS